MDQVQTTEAQTSNGNLKKGVIGILSLSVIAAIGVFLSQQQKQVVQTPETNQNTETPATPSASGTQIEQITAGTYKNGVYASVGSYSSPAGNETIDITLVVNGDTVTSATFKGNATNPGSVKWQGEFGEGFEQAVVGKKIDELALTVVNGSSLTPKGFMDALAKIKTQAKG